MNKRKSKKDDFLWWVQCEGHYDVPVIAPNWELATVEAAHLWGVPWAKVAARCELREKLPYDELLPTLLRYIENF